MVTATGGARPELSTALLAVSTLREFRDLSERLFLLHKLEENSWNVTQTAQAIDTPRSNLYKKLEQYDIRSGRDRWRALTPDEPDAEVGRLVLRLLEESGALPARPLPALLGPALAAPTSSAPCSSRTRCAPGAWAPSWPTACAASIPTRCSPPPSAE